MPTAVLIVNYRGYDDLHRCLESLEPHLRPDDEVAVVDHATEDHKLARIRAQHPYVVTIPRADNLGFSAGINLAASHTRAPFLLLLNPDTIVEGPVIAVMEDWLQTHPATAVVGPRVLNGDGSTQPSARSFPGFSTVFGGRSTWLTRRHPNNWLSRRNLLGLDTTDALDVDWVSGSCLMTRRTTFDQIGGLDERFFLYWEDADYCRRVVASGGQCTYLPRVAVQHLGGGSAKYTLPRAIRAFHKSAYQLYWKHAGTGGRMAAPLVRAGLHLRGEMRLRSALRELSAAAAARRQPVVSVDHISNAARAPAEAKHSVQGV